MAGLNNQGEAGSGEQDFTAYLARLLPAGRYDFYLSGRRDMIAEATHIIDQRFAGSFVFNEIFY